MPNPNPAPSAVCTVQDGTGSPVSSAGGVNVTPGNTITITLSNTARVTSWTLSIVGIDAVLNPPPAVTMGTGFTATFTAPAAGSAIVLRSIVNDGLVQSTFSLYTLTSGTTPGRAQAANDALQTPFETYDPRA